jgi:inward rectifier potassium channel
MRRRPRYIRVRSGQFEFVKLNAEKFDWRDTYHFILTLTWPGFAALVFGVYLLINCVFAGLYLLDAHGVAEMSPGSFPDAFFFSVETLATVGYGHMYPESLYGHLITMIEIMVGMFGLAVITGLIFVRFSRPTARIYFSKVAVIAPFDGVPNLMIRVANLRHQAMVEPDFRMILLRNTATAEGQEVRRFRSLKLDFDHLIAFPAVLTVRHQIDEESPLFGMTPENFQEQDIRIVASIVGVDTVIVAPVQSFGDYNYDQIQWNRNFVEIYDQNEKGEWTVDYGRIDETEDIAPIQNMAKDQEEQAVGQNTTERNGRMEGWKGGRVEEWKSGRVEEWKGWGRHAGGGAHLIAVLALVVPLGACVSYPTIPATGRLANTHVSTTVDSELAKHYLAASSRQSAASADVTERDAGIERRFGGRPLDWMTLKEISDETSPDFATIFFINRCLADRTNERLQTGYSGELQRIESLIRQRNLARTVRTCLRGYKFLFIPGFHYLSDPTSGADFANQRQLMHGLGLDVQLAATEEDGTIEENAEIIARIVRSESRYHSKLILVSTSKSGPETALALGRILRLGETMPVKAWISVGGLIRGTFLADRIVAWPKSWISRIIFSFEKVDFRSLPGLTSRASRARMNSIRLPCQILVLQYVAAPLSGNIAQDVVGRYTYLRKYGPNDGLTLLADELLPGGITIVEPGLDHFYRDPEINLKSLAIANLVADEIKTRSTVQK